MSKLRMFKDHFANLPQEKIDEINKCGQKASNGMSLIFDTDSECYKKIFGERKVNIIHTIVDGTIGITKAVMNLEPTQKEVVENRLAICHSCPNWSESLGGRCTKCDCFTWAKVRNSSSKCPEGKW